MKTLSDLLSEANDYLELASYTAEIIPTLTPDIAEKLAIAQADPTAANVEAVISAYASSGQVPPPKLVAYLITINERDRPGDTVRGDVAPWLFLAVAVGYFVLRRKR